MSPRYGSVAVTTLLQKLMEAGAQRENLRAKVFGGGCLFESMQEHNSKKEHLGQRNIDTALEILTKEQIPIVSVQAGVNRGQRVVFHTDSGESVVAGV